MISLSRNFNALFLAATAYVAGMYAARAATVAVPNGSFESPPTTFAFPAIDDWQQVPLDFFAPVSGVFSNVPPPIDNADGSQVAFLFATNGATIFVDYDAVDWQTATHVFNATYEVGKSYTFTIGVIGGTNLAIPMLEGTTLQLGMYYRNDLGGMVTIASTTITNSGSLFPSPFHLVDFQVQLPVVQATNAWAGRHIGLQVLSTTDPELQSSGYWDLDNVRLTTGPSLTANSWTNGQFNLTLQSYPGTKFEILATTNPTTPGSNWISIGTVTNVTGAVSVTDGGASSNQRYYRAHQVP